MISNDKKCQDEFIGMSNLLIWARSALQRWLKYISIIDTVRIFVDMIDYPPGVMVMSPLWHHDTTTITLSHSLDMITKYSFLSQISRERNYL